MSRSTTKILMLGVAIAVAAAGVSGFALGSAQLEQIGSLSNNEGIVVDLKTFKIAKGSASGDTRSCCRHKSHTGAPRMQRSVHAASRTSKHSTARHACIGHDAAPLTSWRRAAHS
jgi:hypothetical protein